MPQQKGTLGTIRKGSGAQAPPPPHVPADNPDITQAKVAQSLRITEIWHFSFVGGIIITIIILTIQYDWPTMIPFLKTKMFYRLFWLIWRANTPPPHPLQETCLITLLWLVSGMLFVCISFSEMKACVRVRQGSQQSSCKGKDRHLWLLVQPKQKW